MSTQQIDAISLGPAGIRRRGLLLVLSSPSGAGKTTLARRLLQSDAGITVSVSVTTRAMRAGETDGVDYHFISQEHFETMRASGQLLEWANVFDHKYGTPRAPIEAHMGQGEDVLFDIDWQGAEQLSEKLASDVVRVFVLPPSMQALEQRLRSRGQDSDEVIARRMSRAADEISHWGQYDYALVNDDVDRCFAGLQAILAAERLRRTRQIGLAEFVHGLDGADR